MSHAMLIVALSPEDLAANTDYSNFANPEKIDKKDRLIQIQAAIQHQMSPFHENGQWFGDGTRWDWWQIGGRYSGRLYGGRDILLRSELDESQRLSAFAFLKDRRWCESGGRLGWFGSTTATECERKADADGMEYAGRCIFKNEEAGSEIVTWDDAEDEWGKKYWDRFIRPLAPDTLIVVVDYHV